MDKIDTSFRPTAPESKQEWNLVIDKRWCKRLDIKGGNCFAAINLCKIIQNGMGNITNIYKDIPASRTRDKQACLVKGLDFYLKKDQKNTSHLKG